MFDLIIYKKCKIKNNTTIYSSMHFIIMSFPYILSFYLISIITFIFSYFIISNTHIFLKDYLINSYTNIPFF
jgi:hypothetical protein